ncbi:MAG: sulfotransferase domain-containing protein [Cyanobacteria bacterium J06621_11]
MLSHDHPIDQKPVDEPADKPVDQNEQLSSVLQKAQIACEQENWTVVISACQQVVACCHQKLADSSNKRQATQKVARLVEATPVSAGCSASMSSPAPTPPFPPPAGEPAIDEPAMAAIYQSKAVLYEEQGLRSKAIDALQNAVSIKADSAELHVQLATLYAKEQQWVDAANHYEQVLSLSARMGESHSEKGTPENQAVKGIRTALAIVWLKLAEALKQRGDIEGAVRNCLKAVQQDPKLYAAYNRLRYNILRYDVSDGDPILQAVVAVCQQTITRHPELHAAFVTLGYALTKLGQLDQAVDCYRRASDFVTQRKLNALTTEKDSPSVQTALTISAQRLRPSFVVIGAEKCGTTSLYQYLAAHPQMLASVEKEIDFFDMEYHRGLAWYLSHFPGVPAESGTAESSPAKSRPSQLLEKSQWLTGETSANYLYSDVAPARLFEQFPQIQLVVILRHPVDRTISRYNMMVRNGVEKRSFEAVIADEMQLIEQAQACSLPDSQTGEKEIPWSVLNRCRHIGNSLYYYHLQRWLKHFTLDQLLVLRSEDLFTEPEQTLNSLCQTLGMLPSSAKAYQKHNAGQYDSVSKLQRQRLFDFYKPHISKLETLLSRSFDWSC